MFALNVPRQYTNVSGPGPLFRGFPMADDVILCASDTAMPSSATPDSLYPHGQGFLAEAVA